MTKLVDKYPHRAIKPKARYVMKKILIFTSVIMLNVSVSAKSYWFGGLGLQTDLGQLGSTIMVDGLTASTGPGDKAIVAENKLKTASAATGNKLMYSPKSEGALTGGILNLGYERDIKEHFFARISLNYTEKIMGGHNITKVGVYDWYNVRFNYHSWIIPVHFGLKLKMTDKSTFYIGGGMNYYQGGFGIKGRVDGKSIASLGDRGKLLADALGVSNTQIIDEDVQFRVKGKGMNWVIGASAPLDDKTSVFFEVETILSGQQGKGVTKSEGGKQAMAYEVYYPVILGGTIYRVGYKKEI